MEVKNKLFHGLRLPYIQDTKMLQTQLLDVLQNRAILSRNDIKLRGIECPDRARNQSDDEICLATHQSVLDNRAEKVSIMDAFKEYIIPCQSFILNESILNDYDYQVIGDIHEIRVKKSIDLDKYLVALSFHSDILEDINRLYIDLYSGEEIKSYRFSIFTKSIGENMRKEFEFVRTTLDNYGYENIPIVSVLDGKNYDIDNTMKKLEYINKNNPYCK